MRALTLIRPMAAAIVHGTKRIENRPANLPSSMRDRPTIVAVHAGKKWDDEYARVVHEIDGVWADKYLESGFHYAHVKETPYEAHLRDEGVVGLMLLSGRVFTSRQEVQLARTAPRVAWFGGPFGYEVARAIPFAKPIPCRGMQGFWPLPREIEEERELQRAWGELTRGVDIFQLGAK